MLSGSSRFPAPILPTVSQWEDMLSTAFSLAIVGYVINLAMGRTLGAKHGYDVDPNQVLTCKHKSGHETHLESPFHKLSETRGIAAQESQ